MKKKKDAPPSFKLLDKESPIQGPCAESEEKHEPASDADAAVVDSLKALDLNRPIREADIPSCTAHVPFRGRGNCTAKCPFAPKADVHSSADIETN
jgi:hypothetical protein